MDEPEAIARVQRGDISGLEVLVRTYQVQALRAAQLITRDRGLAEDVVQSAFLRAYERIHQFDPERPFGPWFLRSVVNDALKAATRCGRELSMPTDDQVTTADLAPGPDEVIELLESGQTVRQAIDQLPPTQRAVIVLRYYLGLTDVEAADQLGCPPGTVKWRLHAARARLRDLLRPLRSVTPRPGPIPARKEDDQ